MLRLVLACILLALIAAGMFLYFHFADGPPFVNFKPGALDNYQPNDAAAIVSIDLKQLRDQGAFEKPVGKRLREALESEDLGVPFALLGGEALADVDGLRLVFSAGDHSQPLVLLRGRFDRTRFKTGRSQLEEMKQEGFRLYRYRDDGRDTTIALAGDTLVVCLDRSRVVDALRHAAGKATAKIRDDRLREMLEKVDRSKAVWFAANLAKLGKPSQLLFEAQLRPVFEETAALRGAAAWDAELRAEAVLSADAEEDAVRLETHLQGVVKVAAALAPFTREEYEKLVMRLFANAEIARRGKDVTLRSRLKQ